MDSQYEVSSPNVEELMELDLSDLLSLQRKESGFDWENSIENFQKRYRFSNPRASEKDLRLYSTLKNSSKELCDEERSRHRAYNKEKPDGDVRKRKIKSCPRNISEKTRLYKFIIQLLGDSQSDCVKWINKKTGEFEITNSELISLRWGQVKRNPNMTYDKLARGLRHYYKINILRHYKHREKLRYRFSQEVLECLEV